MVAYSKDIENVVRSIIERSATPFEKLNGDMFTQGQEIDPIGYKYWTNEWTNILSSDQSEEKLRRFLDFADLQEHDVHQLFAPAYLQDSTSLPFWTNTLRFILGYKYETSRRNSPNSLTVEVKNQLSQVFVHLLKSSTRASSLLSTDAWATLEEHFKLKIASVIREEIIEEGTYSDSVDKGEIVDDDLEQSKVGIMGNDVLSIMFVRYPMMGRCVATYTHNLVSFVRAFLDHYEKDRDEISSYFELGEVSNIENIQIGLSDPHKGGKSVIILSCNNGKNVVYKPRNISIAHSFNKFCEWINQQLDCGLKLIKVIDKLDYGWAEYIDHRPCRSGEALNRYYERAGILLGVAYMLDGTDIHGENLIAHGEYPVIVDLETILQPNLNITGRENKIAHQVMGKSLDSVYRTYLLPFKTEIEDYTKICGFGPTHSSICDTTSGLTKSNSKLVQVFPNLPFYEGVPYEIATYKSDLVLGFTKFYELVIEKRTELLSSQGVLSFFSNLELRSIFRATKIYARIGGSLFKSKHLKSSNHFGLQLELLSRAYLTDEEKPHFWQVLQQEREEMLRLDIPFFTCWSHSKALKLKNGDQIASYFDGDCIQNIKRKIRRFGSEDLEQQLQIIEQSLSSTASSI